MRFIRGLGAAGKETGQMVVWFALLVPLIMLFAGLAIDFGIAFLTRAELAKAADATALAVMRNLGQPGGETTASTIGQNIFLLDYNASSTLNAAPPTVAISYSTDASGDPVVNVAATAKIKTFFIKLAGFNTLTVSDSSQATRPPVILSLVLDTSGSMAINGGGAALPGAVDDFLDYFINGTDRLGEVSFSSIASNDVAVTQDFQTAIKNSANGLQYAGATFAQAGLQDSENQVLGFASPPPNAVKVVVFFTDGWANTNQDHLPSPSGALVNYGGCSQAEYNIGWCLALFCMNPTTGATISYTQGTSGTCNGQASFPPQDPALPNPALMNLTNIGLEATYRTEQLAAQMRAQGITVYTIGLGDEINSTYLEELANVNDPSNPTYNPSQPSGLFEFAAAADGLDAAFQEIASKIVLRLTQ